MNGQNKVQIHAGIEFAVVLMIGSLALNSVFNFALLLIIVMLNENIVYLRFS